MFRTSHLTLKIFAAIVWLSGVLFLFLKSSRLLMAAHINNAHEFWILLAVVLGVGIGWIKAKYLFTRLCRKNLVRIDSLDKPKIWQFYRLRFFLFLFLMIMLGRYLATLGQGNNAILVSLASLELSIGTALLLSSPCFLQKDRQV